MPVTNPAARRACRIAAALAALALALPAQAQRTRKDDATGRARLLPAAPAAKTPAAAPAPATAAPGASLAAGPATASGGWRAMFASRGPGSLGLGVGAFSSSKANGLAVHLDSGYVATPPAWRRLELEWRLRAMFARPSDQQDLTRTIAVGYTPIAIPAGFQDTSVYVFEVGPLARVRYALGPKLAIFADAGVGIAQTVEKYEREELYIGHTTEKQNVTALYLGGALGLAFEATDRLRVMMLPVAFSAHLGTDYSAFLPTLAVAYRL